MAMTRREALAATLAGGLAMTGSAHAEEKPLTLDPPARMPDRERQLLEEGGPVIVKVFVASLRERFSDETAGELRKYIDPRYLKDHGLQDGPFPIRRVVTKSIQSNDLADDPRTAFNIAETEDAAKELFLFRLTIYEGNVYIAPLSPPDKKSKAFNPWILRRKV
jgi:hypothetical protein